MPTIKIHSKKMKTIDLREDKLAQIRCKIIDLCNKSFYDGGCVNDADLDGIEEMIRKIMK